MARRKSETKQDLSSFMAILIMTIGVLVVLLVSNTVIIISNPENTAITSVVTSALYVPMGEGTEGGSPFPHGNVQKEPNYIDVHRDRVILYPGSEVVPVRDLERVGNPLERKLDRVEAAKDQEYIVLLVRPRAAAVQRRLVKAIRDRGIDIGLELFEAGREVNYEVRRAAAMKEL